MLIPPPLTLSLTHISTYSSANKPTPQPPTDQLIHWPTHSLTHPLRPEFKFPDDKFAQLGGREGQEVNNLVDAAQELISTELELWK